PDLIFFTGKVALLRDEARPFLQENYLHLGYEIWGRAESLPVWALGQKKTTLGGIDYVKTSVAFWREKLNSPEAEFLSLSTTHDLIEHPRAVKLLDAEGRVSDCPDSISFAQLQNYAAVLLPAESVSIRYSRFPRIDFGGVWGVNALFQ